MVFVNCFLCNKKILDKVKVCFYCDFCIGNVLVEDIECK